jgi:hypothetical protein
MPLQRSIRIRRPAARRRGRRWSPAGLFIGPEATFIRPCVSVRCARQFPPLACRRIHLIVRRLNANSAGHGLDGQRSPRPCAATLKAARLDAAKTSASGKRNHSTFLKICTKPSRRRGPAGSGGQDYNSDHLSYSRGGGTQLGVLRVRCIICARDHLFIRLNGKLRPFGCLLEKEEQASRPAMERAPPARRARHGAGAESP